MLPKNTESPQYRSSAGFFFAVILPKSAFIRALLLRTHKYTFRALKTREIAAIRKLRVPPFKDRRATEACLPLAIDLAAVRVRGTPRLNLLLLGSATFRPAVLVAP